MRCSAGRLTPIGLALIQEASPITHPLGVLVVSVSAQVPAEPAVKAHVDSACCAMPVAPLYHTYCTAQPPELEMVTVRVCEPAVT